MKNNRIIIGTANFGGNYGNFRHSKITLGAIEEIINTAQQNGIDHFDTAKSYGDTELILGKFLNKSQPIYIDTKIGAPECRSIDSILTAIKDSLNKLGIPKLNTLYLHNSELLSGEQSAITKGGMEKVIELGLADHLGVSVYTLDELTKAKSNFPLLSNFQIIENICDRRLIKLRELMDLTYLGNVVNIRSVFLQGLLLANVKDLPNKFQSAVNSIESLNKYANESGVSILDLCIAYVKQIPWVGSYLIGVESTLQLKEILESNFELKDNWEEYIFSLPTDLKDPRFWL